MNKKIFLVVFVVLALVVGALFLPTNEKQVDYDYLRLHIRANSNQQIDQNVKYIIKDNLVDYLSPYFCQVKTKQEAINITKSLSQNITYICEKVLKEKGFNYSANVKISNEYFPTRTYANTTLESGFYDAVIVELGEAKGDNWWCVMYPPLCFVNKNENNIQIKYKSKIVEWFKSK